MDGTAWLAIGVIALAVYGVMRGIDVRLVLLTAALVLGVLSGKLPAVVAVFLETFSSEKFVVPICAAMGFAYVLKFTGCDHHLVRLLVEPVRRVRVLMIPGVVLVGFLVNIPVISQTSTAVCLGTVVVPLMRAAGFSPLTIGSALLLGASVGGELLNPGAPELLTVKDKTGVDTREMIPVIIPLVFPVLIVSTLVFWILTVWAERRTPVVPIEAEPVAVQAERINPLKALVPLVPLALLFLSGPPLKIFTIPPEWVIVKGPNTDSYNTRLIGLAMLVGVAVAALVTPRKAHGCMKAFFEGAGYGFTNIVSLIVTANCFGKGIEHAGLATHLGTLIAGAPGLLVPLAGLVPAAFAFISGSGMASTQSLYGFFHAPTVALGQDPIAIGAMVSVGSAAGRTASPVAAVTLMCATLTEVKPFDLVKRVILPLLAGLCTAIALRF